ncbi:MAG: prepilin-type N-terminal cleavage/methylation domain-containing protein [Planctomycetota bacterium]
MKPRNHAAAGFTLLEVLLASVILAIGMTALLSLFTFAGALTSSAMLQRQSAHAAEAILGDLPGKLFPIDDRGLPGLPVELADQEVPGHPRLRYSAHATAVETGALAPDGGPLEFDVEVEFAFTLQGVRRARTFHTRLLREQSFAERLAARLRKP